MKAASVCPRHFAGHGNGRRTSTSPCIRKVPYTGITFVGIPEYQTLGTVVGPNVAGWVAGKTSMEQTLKSNQNQVERAMEEAGYLK